MVLVLLEKVLREVYVMKTINRKTKEKMAIFFGRMESSVTLHHYGGISKGMIRANVYNFKAVHLDVQLSTMYYCTRGLKS